MIIEIVSHSTRILNISIQRLLVQKAALTISINSTAIEPWNCHLVYIFVATSLGVIRLHGGTGGACILLLYLKALSYVLKLLLFQDTLINRSIPGHGYALLLHVRASINIWISLIYLLLLMGSTFWWSSI